jgi:hypothetical protein
MSDDFQKCLNTVVESVKEVPNLKTEIAELQEKNKELQKKNKELQEKNKEFQIVINEVSLLVSTIESDETNQTKRVREEGTDSEDEGMLPSEKRRKGEKSNSKLELVIGDTVEATYNGGRRYYPGKIVDIYKDGTYKVQYEDGDVNDHVNRREIKKLLIPDDDSEDEEVEEKNDNEDEDDNEGENKKKKEGDKGMETSIDFESQGVEESESPKPKAGRGRPKKTSTPFKKGGGTRKF